MICLERVLACFPLSTALEVEGSCFSFFFFLFFPAIPFPPLLALLLAVPPPPPPPLVFPATATAFLLPLSISFGDFPPLIIALWQPNTEGRGRGSLRTYTALGAHAQLLCG